MTTVAVDLDRMTMASDSKCSDGGPGFLTQKIFTARDGTLIGFCGALADASLFVEWYINGADRANLPKFSASDTFDALTLSAEGCFQWNSSGARWPMLSRRYAMGSGAMPATAALLCGKSIEEAIAIACALDPYSCEPVVSIDYAPPKPKRAPRKPKAAPAKIAPKKRR